MMKATPNLIEREIDALATDPYRVVRAVEVYRLIRDSYDDADFATKAQLDRLTSRLYAEGFGISLEESV